MSGSGRCVKMTDDELEFNIHLAVNFLVPLLRKIVQIVQALYSKSTSVLRHSLNPSAAIKNQKLKNGLSQRVMS